MNELKYKPIISKLDYRSIFKIIPTPSYLWQKKDNDLLLVDYNNAAREITENKAKGLEFLDIQGSGLGLFISKEIIELHGGHISAESAGRNMGAKFTIELPIE